MIQVWIWLGLFDNCTNVTFALRIDTASRGSCEFYQQLHQSDS